jgi:hypothetical protein
MQIRKCFLWQNVLINYYSHIGFQLPKTPSINLIKPQAVFHNPGKSSDGNHELPHEMDKN